MKTYINGQEVEGTPEEISTLLNLMSKAKPKPQANVMMTAPISRGGHGPRKNKVSREAIIPIAKEVLSKAPGLSREHFYPEVFKLAREKGINGLIPPPMVKGIYNDITNEKV